MIYKVKIKFPYILELSSVKVPLIKYFRLKMIPIAASNRKSEFAQMSMFINPDNQEQLTN